MPQMRLDKLLSHLNCGSRKEVQALIRAGRVSVDGTVQKDPAFKVDPDRSQTAVDGTVQRYRAQRYYMLNKPMGVITASRDERHDTVLELFPAELRRGLFAVGRLDKDTEGLLLITDDGALSHALMSPNRHVEKEYEAVVDGALAADAVLRFEQGMTYALAALKDAGFAPSKRIRLLFGTNEETGCGDMSWYVSHGGELPVYGFTPDGEYPIINGEKGILNGTYSRKLHQTGDYRLIKFEGGAASNISPAYAAAELQCPADAASKISADKVTVTPIEGGIRVEAEGIAVHGSTPEQGENAIGRLAQALNQLPLTGELGDCMAFVAERIGMEVHGESLGLAMRDELSGPLTLNLGVAKFEQETLSLTMSVRYPVTLKYELVYPRLSRGFTLGGFTETEMTHAAAIYMPPESELIRRLSKVYE